MLQVICYTSNVLCCMSYVINALHSVLSSSKYISHVNLSHVTCHMSHVTRHMSHDAFHMSHVIHYMSLEMPCMHACFYECIHPVSHFNLSHVTRHMSLVTCHMSQVMCHMSHVIFHMFLDMLCIVQSPWCWPNKMTIYRAPRQPKRSKIKKWSSSVPRPDTQNENELWILIY